MKEGMIYILLQTGYLKFIDPHACHTAASICTEYQTKIHDPDLELFAFYCKQELLKNAQIQLDPIILGQQVTNFESEANKFMLKKATSFIRDNLNDIIWCVEQVKRNRS